MGRHRVRHREAAARAGGRQHPRRRDAEVPQPVGAYPPEDAEAGAAARAGRARPAQPAGGVADRAPGALRPLRAGRSRCGRRPASRCRPASSSFATTRRPRSSSTPVLRPQRGTGLFDVEYADVFGIPFDFTAKPVPIKPPALRETVLVRAITPERDACEIRFPRVAGYRVVLPEERLTARLNDDSTLELTPALVGPVPSRASRASSAKGSI